jgi:hypothetical protein
LANNRLTQADLDLERDWLSAIGFKLKVTEFDPE